MSITPRYSRDGVTLYQGDCLRIMPQLQANSYDAIVTDPPYSSGGLHRTDRVVEASRKYLEKNAATIGKVPTFDGDNRDQRSYLLWTTLWMSDALRVAKDGAVIIVFSDWRQVPTVSDALQVAGWVWRGMLVWDKVHTRPQPGRFTQTCEFMLWGSKGPLPLDRHAPVLPSVYRHGSARNEERVHVTSKPISLMKELMRIVEPNGCVLDPFAGGGGTIVACQSLGIPVTGIEYVSEYVDVAIKRLGQLRLGLDA